MVAKDVANVQEAVRFCYAALMIYGLRLQQTGVHMASTANVQFSWAASTTPGVTNQTLTIAATISGSGSVTLTGVNLAPSVTGYTMALPANTLITATLNAVIMNGGVALVSPPTVLSFNTGPVNPPNAPSNFNYQVVTVA